jgi:hypothetical protein
LCGRLSIGRFRRFGLVVAREEVDAHAGNRRKAENTRGNNRDHCAAAGVALFLLLATGPIFVIVAAALFGHAFDALRFLPIRLGIWSGLFVDVVFRVIIGLSSDYGF